VPPAALAEVVEVETEKIVAFDHIGIELGQSAIEGEQELALRRGGRGRERENPSRAPLGKADRKDPVLRLGGVTEAIAAGGRFDVELAAPELAEAEVAIKPGTALE